MKRIISILLSIFILLPTFSFPVYSKDEGWQGILDVLSVSDESEKSAFVTRGEFLSALLKTLNMDYEGYSENPVFADVTVGHKYFGQIMYAAKAGIVMGSSDGKFYPDDYITPNEAGIMSIRAMGYNEQYKANGYFDTISYINLFDDVDLLYEYINRNDMKTILINILLAPYPEKVYDSASFFKYGGTKSFLEVKWGLYYDTGIADATELHSLTGFPTKAGYVSVDGEQYKSPEQITEQYFGMKIRFFYTDDSGEKIIRYAYPVDNTSYEHSGREFSSFNGKQFVFYDENGKSSTYNIDAKTSLIWNNRNMNTSDFKQKADKSAEKFIIIDNNNDNVSDVVIAYTYTVYIPKVTDSLNEVIVDENNNLELGKYKNYICYDAGGNEINIDSIKKDVHYLVYDPGDYDCIIIVSECEVSADGTVSSTDETQKIVMLENGDEYYLSKNARVSIDEIKMGYTYKFYFDKNWEIIDVSQTENDSVESVYMIKGEKSGGLGKGSIIKLLRENGNIEVVPLASRIDFRDSNGNQSRVNTTDALAKLSSSGKFLPQIAFVRFNSKGEIIKIILPCNDVTKEYHIQDYTKNTTYKGAARRWMQAQYSFENQIQLKASTKVFVVPYHELDEQEDEYYTVSSVSMFTNDKAYVLNEFEGPIDGRYTSVPVIAEAGEFAADYFVLECPENTKFTSGSTVFGLVTEISDCYDKESEEEYKKLTMLEVYSGSVIEYDFKPDKSILSDRDGVPIERGDIIKIVSSGGFLKENNALVFYDLSEDEYKFVTSFDVGSGASNEIGYRYYATRVTEGVVSDIKGDIAKCTNMRENRTNLITEYVSTQYAKIVEFNTKKNSYEVKSASYLKPGDSYVAVMNAGLFMYIIFYKDGE